MNEETLELFEKDILKMISKEFPKLEIPLYVSPLDTENATTEQLSAYATWSDVDESLNLDDNYCRRRGTNDTYVYPVKNASGRVDLKSCDAYINKELRELASVRDDVKMLLSDTKEEMVKNEKDSVNSIDKVNELMNRKITELEDTQEQLMLLRDLLNNMESYMDKYSKDVKENEQKLSTIDNDYNLSRDKQNDFNKIYEDNKKRNERMFKSTKYTLYISCILVILLFLTINIKKIIT